MSAINVLQYQDGAAVWTDGAHYLADGTLMAIAPKIEIMSHLNAVVAARAPSLFLPIIALKLGQTFETFDGLLGGMEDVVYDTWKRHKALFDQCELGADFDLVVVGWSESRDRSETWVLCSKPHGEDAEWQVRAMGPVAIAPANEALEAELASVNERMVNHLHPVEDGMRIIEMQRGVSACQGGRDEPSHGVGGFAQMTFVARNQITTAIMRRWPDAIGQRLGG